MANNILAKMAVIIDAQTASFNTALKQSSFQLGKFTGDIKSLGKQIVAGFGAIEIGRQIINVTGEFQKFQAVLSNTLGSDSAAAKALTNIKDFASKTPFAVNELTSSFVKLANQGFVPTTGQLRSLGDLASSTGKSFDQLTEAIIDAQTGEFERLKEFGIRAKKSGDDVAFTFKGVTTTVKNTSGSIRDYILALGDAEGVSGSMAKISDTLEGKISNLGDAWDNLLLTIGKGNSGILVGAVSTLTTLVNRLSNAGSELELDKVSLGLKNFRDLSKETLDYILNIEKTESGKAISDLLAPLEKLSNTDFFKNINASQKQFNDILSAEGANVEEVTTLWKRYVERRVEAEKSNRADDFVKLGKSIQDAKIQAEAFLKAITFNVSGLKTIDEVQNKIKLLTTARDGSTGATLSYYNNRLIELRDRLKELENQGVQFGVITKLQNEIAKIESKKIKTNNIFDFGGFNDAIEKVRNKINFLNSQTNDVALPRKTGQDFLANFQLDDKSIDEHLERARKNIKRLGNSIKKEFVDIGPLIANGISGIADAIGSALGSGNFSDFGGNLLRALTSFMRQLGELMIGLGVAKVALQFSNNPYVLIAAGAALVIASSAISSLQAKQSSIVSGSGSFSGSGGSSASTARATNSFNREGQEIKLSGEFTARGPDLVYVFNKQEKLMRRTG